MDRSVGDGRARFTGDDVLHRDADKREYFRIRVWKSSSGTGESQRSEIWLKTGIWTDDASDLFRNADCSNDAVAGVHVAVI